MYINRALERKRGTLAEQEEERYNENRKRPN